MEPADLFPILIALIYMSFWALLGYEMAEALGIGEEADEKDFFLGINTKYNLNDVNDF